MRALTGTFRRVAAALALALSAAGCAGEGTALIGGPGGATTASVEPGASVAAAPAQKAAFNPFSTDSEASHPAREVLQNPSRDEVMKTGSIPEFSVGRADAPVTIIKYMSLTCPYCRKFHAEVFPVLKREYIDRGLVRFVFREFPIGKTSGAATIALRCAPQSKYLELYGAFLQRQSHWVSQEVRLDAIHKVVQQVGMTRAQLDACMQNQGMIDGLKWVKERGRKLGVIGTPNFFVENRLVKKVMDMADIRAMVDPLLAGRVARR